jgi:hypothetical protein
LSIGFIGFAYGIGKGTITVEAIASNDNDINIIQLKNVVHAPKMLANILSSTVLYDLGLKVSVKPRHSINIRKDGEFSLCRVEFHHVQHISMGKFRDTYLLQVWRKW